MKEMLFDIYGYAVFFYSLLLIINYTVLMFLSFNSHRREKTFLSIAWIKKMLSDSPYTPGVSIIAPAYNEESNIIDNVVSMLSVDYPKFEVVIVNDGSTDSTLEKLIDYFCLVEVPFAYHEAVKCAPVRRVFKSTKPIFEQLTVVDKENGGTKADASNAGINASRYPYFIDTDVDCIIDKYALYRLVWAVLKEKTPVIAVSSTMLMVNGCKVENGRMVESRVSKRPIPLFQQVEYLRSYLVGKMGWSALNAVNNVSGGFGFFRRDVVVAVGGYDSSSFAEDMDLVMRMISYMCELNQPYRIPHVAETTCWTEGPPTLWSLNKQRTRWARGLMQCMLVHRKLLFNPRYKRLGLITYPFMFVFEFVAPIIEFIGYISLIWFILIGAVNWMTFWVILLMLYTFNEFMLLVICFFSYYVEDPSNRNSKWDYVWLFIASLFEPILYHPLIVFFSVKGYFSFLTKRSFKWEDIKREGFGKERQREEERRRQREEEEEEEQNDSEPEVGSDHDEDNDNDERR